MQSDDPSLVRRWKRFLLPAEVLGQIVRGEVNAERTLKGAKFLGATFYHDRQLIAMFYERDDFPETTLGDEVPTEVLQVERLLRIFH